MKLSTTMATALLALAAVTAASVQAKDNLAPDAPLQTDVTFLPATCASKSAAGDKLSMHYTGSLLTDGSVFDSSLPRNTPFDFTLGAGEVIKGWDQGLVGMCVGEKRNLTIPSDLGYGNAGSPPDIPGKATLVFAVELLKLTKSQVGSEAEPKRFDFSLINGGDGATR